MKAETWERNILNLHRGVQDAEDEPKSPLVLRPDTGVASLFEERAVPYGQNCESQKVTVTHNVSGYNPARKRVSVVKCFAELSEL